jgi:hypothetical protein
MWTEDAGARPSLVLREDIEMSEAIQETLDATQSTGIPLSYQEARIYHAHQSADAAIGREHIPPELQVQAVLNEAWWHPNEPRLA